MVHCVFFMVRTKCLLKEVEAWARRRLRARQRGARWETGPTGGPHLSVTPGERRGRGLSWGVASGRPSKARGERRGSGPAAH
uniref:Uncharacterized protein n=1 Tax=Oryza sativa subsp. japonica TaxID=39947 RepID=Q6K2N5_ORYSJ|nr:hypothetical protein [Oryza sativa Japonica Group]